MWLSFLVSLLVRFGVISAMWVATPSSSPPPRRLMMFRLPFTSSPSVRYRARSPRSLDGARTEAGVESEQTQDGKGPRSGANTFVPSTVGQKKSLRRAKSSSTNAFLAENNRHSRSIELVYEERTQVLKYSARNK